MRLLQGGNSIHVSHVSAANLISMWLLTHFVFTFISINYILTKWLHGKLNMSDYNNHQLSVLEINVLC